MGETFVIPKDLVQKDTMLIPGTDGEKMSKSRHNFIDIFSNEKELKKQVMGIQTDSKTLEEPKDPDSCNVYNLYKLLASKEDNEIMREQYLRGGFGYGHAKTALLQLILAKFENERAIFYDYMDHPEKIEKILLQGAIKAKKVADIVLNRVRGKMGISVQTK